MKKLFFACLLLLYPFTEHAMKRRTPASLVHRLKHANATKYMMLRNQNIKKFHTSTATQQEDRNWPFLLKLYKNYDISLDDDDETTLEIARYHGNKSKLQSKIEEAYLYDNRPYYYAFNNFAKLHKKIQKATKEPDNDHKEDVNETYKDFADELEMHTRNLENAILLIKKLPEFDKERPLFVINDSAYCSHDINRYPWNSIG